MSQSDGSIPQHLSALLNKLSETGTLFIEVYISREERLRAIARELVELSEKVIDMNRDANRTNQIWAALGGVGLAVGVVAALFARSEEAVGMALLGGAAAATAGLVGGAGVFSQSQTQEQTEQVSMETIENLEREFMATIDLIMDYVKKINKVAEKLKENLTGAQANIILSITKQSRRVMDVSQTTRRQLRKALNFISEITQTTPTVVEEARLRNFLTESALRCDSMISEFAMMRDLLEDLEEHQTL